MTVPYRNRANSLEIKVGAATPQEGYETGVWSRIKEYYDKNRTDQNYDPRKTSHILPREGDDEHDIWLHEVFHREGRIPKVLFLKITAKHKGEFSDGDVGNPKRVQHYDLFFHYLIKGREDGFQSIKEKQDFGG